MYIGIDLGSTNMKAALYDSDLRLISRKGRPVTYIRENGFVEFDPELYFDTLVDLLSEITRDAGCDKVTEIAFTGQAESFVCLDENGKAISNMISWMDERSEVECGILSEKFPIALCREKTGQQAIIPTWPATKILWLKHNRPDVYEKTATYMLLKDYIVFRLTGVKCADMSIATFSFYFDIYNKCYWREMLDAIGISEKQLPPLVEPCTVAGTLTESVQKALGLTTPTRVNVGTLDHFAGMIGSGNTAPGSVTLSTGTTMVLASLVAGEPPVGSDSAMHYGFLPDSYVMLPVIESGGTSLDWFRSACMQNMDYKTMDKEILACENMGSLLFLPYLVGTNAPDFDREATGVFYGLRQEHTAIHMAKAVIEGVSYVLRKNCDDIKAKGTPLSAIVATGGGAKSPVWCQAQADITGLPVIVPSETESACLGAAIIAACSDGRYSDLASAAREVVGVAKRYEPCGDDRTERNYRRFNKLYRAALDITLAD